MSPDSSANDSPDAARAAAATTIARVLDQIGGHPVHTEFAATDGGVVARVVLEEDVCELLCDLTSDGDLIAVRLIEL